VLFRSVKSRTLAARVSTSVSPTCIDEFDLTAKSVDAKAHCLPEDALMLASDRASAMTGAIAKLTCGLLVEVFTSCYIFFVSPAAYPSWFPSIGARIDWKAIGARIDWKARELFSSPEV